VAVTSEAERDGKGAPRDPSAGRVRIGHVWIDAVTFEGALEAMEALVDAGQGGAAFTPNVDHIVVADRYAPFREAYGQADLSLCDGQPLVWASSLLGLRMPAKVSGADLFLPLMRLAARRGFRVFLLGGGPGVAEEAGRRLREEEGVLVVGALAPRIGLDGEEDEERVVAQLAEARPHLVIACLGSPKGELWIHRVRDRIKPAVALSIGATLDFYVGRKRRAPRWIQRTGLEWLFRLAQEPRRLARRYLIEDPRFLLILLRTLREPRSRRLAPHRDAA